MPILTRAEVQAGGAAFHSKAVPKAHGSIGDTMTSGSTGRPLKTLKSSLAEMMWQALTLREILWHRDFRKKLAIGDFAEVGSCPCGRTLPALTRIMGRTRAMGTLPNGDQFYASFQDLLTGFDMIRQFQVVRRASEALEMKLVATRNLYPAEAERLSKILQKRFRHPFSVSFSYHDKIPRGAGGKFEDYKDETESAS
jgi:phenylacetate-coenzyme A ligase PaaK-like adenylate-forming protein